MPSVNLGRVSIVPKGAWSNSNSYEKLDVVTYGGGSYIANKDVPAGTSLTTTEYWSNFVGALSLGTVETVSASTGASAELITTSTGQTLNLSIPRGVAGNESIDDTKGEGDTDYVWSADKLWNEVNNLDIDINGKANAIEKTVSGNIVSFDNGADNQYVKSLKVNIEPVQNLHGYDAPWPAGGGKNLLDYTVAYSGAPYNGGVGTVVTLTPSTETITINGNTITFTVSSNWAGVTYISPKLSAGTYHFHVDVSSTTNSRMSIYTVDGTTNEIKTAYASSSSTTFNRELTVEENDYIVFVEVVSSAGTITIKDLQVESGSSYTSWSPYSNICPITGWTEANVTRTGRNLFDKATATTGKYIDYKGVEQNNAYCAHSDYIKVKKNTKYYCNATCQGTTYTIRYFDKSKNLLGDNNSAAAGIFNIGNVEYAVINIRTDQVPLTDVVFYESDVSINGTYFPYLGTTLTIPLGQTVYGGTLDVTTGTLTVTHTYVDISTLEWTMIAQGNNVFYANITGAPTNIGTGNTPDVYCSQYTKTSAKSNSAWSSFSGDMVCSLGYDSSRIYVRDSRYSDATSYGNSLSANTLFVYPLATPIIITGLTPVIMRTLLGDNVIWADTGNIINLDYCVDTESYIQKNAVIAKAPIITESASGSIVSIDDGADDMPVESLNVNVEPVQDLHGYENPWPAGGGKNLYNKDADYYGQGKYWVSTAGTLGNSSSYYASPKIPVQSETQYTRNVTDTAANLFYDSNGDFIESEYTGASFTTPSGCYYVAFNTPIETNHDAVQLEKGASSTSYAPYANICPITGWANAKIMRTGINLWGGVKMADDMVASINNSTYCAKGSDTDGNYVSLQANANVDQKLLSTNKFKENTQYTIVIKAKKSNTNSATNLSFWYTDGTYTSVKFSDTITADTLYTFVATSTAGKTIASIKSIFASGTTYFYYDNCGLFEGVLTTADFQPYQGTSVTIPLGQTVYGGTLDVTTGTLTVTKAGKDLGLQSWTWTQTASNEFFYVPINDAQTTGSADRGLCSMYKGVSSLTGNDDCYTWNSNQLRIKDTTYNDETTFKSAVSGQTIIYPLATPIVITGLTPAQITTLLGYNAIWSDCGAVDVSYRADTKLWTSNQIKSASNTIKLMLTSNIETEMKATSNYASGSIVIVGDTFLKTTSAVSSGTNLVIDNNCVKTTIAEWVASLL